MRCVNWIPSEEVLYFDSCIGLLNLGPEVCWLRRTGEEDTAGTLGFGSWGEMGRKPKLSLGPGQVLIKQRTQAAMKEKQERATASHNKPLESHIDVRDLDEVMEQAELAGRVFSALNPLPELLSNP